MSDHRKRLSLKFGSEISLVYEDGRGFLSCTFGVHPRLRMRVVQHFGDVFAFEDCVFVVCPPFDHRTAVSTASSDVSPFGGGGGGADSIGMFGPLSASASSFGAASDYGGFAASSPSSTIGSMQSPLAALGSTSSAYSSSGPPLLGGSSSFSSSALTGAGGAVGGVIEDRMPRIDDEDVAASATSAALLAKLSLMTTDVTYGAKVQLRHKQSGLFLALLPTHPSETDVDCTAVALISPDEAARSPKTSVFRFSPKFKMHNEGDFVCQGDQLLIVGLHHRLFLHVSDVAAAAGNSASGAAAELEVNAAEYPAAWMVRQYDVNTDTADVLRIVNRGKPPVFFGAPVALFHRERESLMSSSIAFHADDNENGGTSSVFGDPDDDGDGNSPAISTFTSAAAFLNAVTGRSTSSMNSSSKGLGHRAPSHKAPGGNDLTVSPLQRTLSSVGAQPGGLGRRQHGQHSAAMLLAEMNPEARKRAFQSMRHLTADASSLSAGTSRSPTSPSPSSQAHVKGAAGSSTDGGGAPPAAVNSWAAQQQVVESTVFPLLVPHTTSTLSNDFSFFHLKCSCAAYWVFENADPTTGGPVRFGQPLRIRQAATNMYLAVEASTARKASTQPSAFGRALSVSQGSRNRGGGAASRMGSSVSLTAGSGDHSSFRTHHSSYGGVGISPEGGDVDDGGLMPRRTPFSAQPSIRFEDDDEAARVADSAATPYRLCLVSVPSAATQDATLFSLHHMFLTDAKYVAETDFFRLRHVATGSWLCTEDILQLFSESGGTGGVGGGISRQSSTVSSQSKLPRGSVEITLQPQPSQHDAWMTGHLSGTAYRDVMHVFHCYAALKAYRDIFARRTKLADNVKQQHEWERQRRDNLSPTRRSPGSGSSASPSVLSSPMGSLAAQAPGVPLPPAVIPDFRLKAAHLAVARRCAEALTSLIYFCSDSKDKDPFEREGLPREEHQRMLFDLQIHRMAMDVILAPLVPVRLATSDSAHATIDLSDPHLIPTLPLPYDGGAVRKEHFDVKHPEFGVLHNVSRLGFRLIKQMVLGNPSFGARMAPYIPVMFELDGMKLHVVEVMHEMFTENWLLPWKAMDFAVHHYVNTLVNRQRSSGYLKFLATMCSRHDDAEGIVENQELVCQRLIRDVPSDKCVLVSSVLLESGDVGVIIPPPSSASKSAKSSGAGSGNSTTVSPPVPIEHFLLQYHDAKLVKYFEGQIELFAKMSAGSASKMCLQTIEQWIPSLQLNAIVRRLVWTGEEVTGRSSKLDATRCNLMKATMNLYVHPVLRNAEVQLALHTVLIGSSTIRRRWAEFRTHAHKSHSGVADTLLMESLKSASMALLQHNLRIVQSDRNRNELLRTVICTWESLIQYRQYSSSDVEQLMPMLLCLLDGKRDVADITGLAVLQRAASSMSSNSSSHTTWAGPNHSHRTSTPSAAAAAASSNSSSGTTPSILVEKGWQSLTVPVARRFQRDEDSSIVMELRHAICRTMLALLHNMIHEGADALIMYLYEALGGMGTPKHRAASTSDGGLQSGASGSGHGSLLTRWLSFKKKPQQPRSEKADREPTDEAGDSEHSDDDGVPSAAPAAIMDEVSRVCHHIEKFFQTHALVPLLFDVSQYQHEALASCAINLLTELCCIRRALCDLVLSVKITPTREMVSHFDRLHGVAVELIQASDSGQPEDLADAVEMVLKTLLQSYAPKGPHGLERRSSALSSSSALLSSNRSPATPAASELLEKGMSEERESPNATSPTSAASQAEGPAPIVVDGDGGGGGGGGGRKKAPRTARVRWAEATTVAKIVAMSRRVQRKRNSLGLDRSNDVPLDVICRAELMCHWGIHETLLQRMACGALHPDHVAFPDVMEFFYYFALSPSNARRLTPFLHLFVESIANLEVRVQAMHVVVAVLSATTATPNAGKHVFGRTPTTPVMGGSSAMARSASVGSGGGVDDNFGAAARPPSAPSPSSAPQLHAATSSGSGNVVDVRILDSIAAMVASELDKREPDCSFLKLVHKHLLCRVGPQLTAALPPLACRQLLNLLELRMVFRNVAQPKAMRSAELQFNSAVVMVLCGLFHVNPSVKVSVQRILPHTAILAVLSRSGSLAVPSTSLPASPSPSSAAPAPDASSLAPLPHIHLSPYYKLLTDVYFTLPEDASVGERQQHLQQWTEEGAWWGILRQSSRQFQEIASTLRTYHAFAGSTDHPNLSMSVSAASFIVSNSSYASDISSASPVNNPSSGGSLLPGTALEQQMQTIRESRVYWAGSMPQCVNAHLTHCFSEELLTSQRGDVLDTFKELAMSVTLLMEELLRVRVAVCLTTADVMILAALVRNVEGVIRRMDRSAFTLLDRLYACRTDHVPQLIDAIRASNGLLASSLSPNGVGGSSSVDDEPSSTLGSVDGSRSFFFQSNHRDMSEAEIAVRKQLQHVVTHDTILPHSAAVESATALQCVAMLSYHVSTSAAAYHHRGSHHHHHHSHNVSQAHAVSGGGGGGVKSAASGGNNGSSLGVGVGAAGSVGGGTFEPKTILIPLTLCCPPNTIPTFRQARRQTGQRSTSSESSNGGENSNTHAKSGGESHAVPASRHAAVTASTLFVHVHALAPSEVERFIVTLMKQMMRLSFSAETIACLLNLLHMTLADGFHFAISGLERFLVQHPEVHGSLCLLPAHLLKSSNSSEKATRQSQQLGGSHSGLVLSPTTDSIAIRQNVLDHLGLMRVVTALSDLSDPVVTKAALDVGIALLDGGNTTVQNAMLRYFETHDESFFHNVRDILQSCFENVHQYNEYLMLSEAATTQRHSPNGTAPNGGADSFPSTPASGVMDRSGSRRSMVMRHRSFLQLTSVDAFHDDDDNSASTNSVSPSNSGRAVAPPAAAAAAVAEGNGAKNPFMFVEETFRFLQLMCEGHHLGMQNYIRVQSDNLHSINVVQEVQLLLSELCAVTLNAHNNKVVVQGLALLTEFCQGPCVQNQTTLLQNDVCGLVAVLLTLNPAARNVTPEERRRILAVQHAASVTLLALMEGCSKPEVYRKALYQVPLRTIERLVRELAALMKRLEVEVPSVLVANSSNIAARPKSEGGNVAEQESNDDEVEDDKSDGDEDEEDERTIIEQLLFSLLIFAKSVTPFLERFGDTASLEIVHRTFQQVPSVAGRLGCIEVERGGLVERVFFPIPEICLSLTQKSKDEVLWAVDRSSRVTKLNDFSQKIDEVIFEMNSTHQCRRFVEYWTRFVLPNVQHTPVITQQSVTRKNGAVDSGTDESDSDNEAAERREEQTTSGSIGSTPSDVGLGWSRWILPLALRQWWNVTAAPYLCSSDSSVHETRALVLAGAVNMLFVLTDGVDADEATTTLVESIVFLLNTALLWHYLVVFLLDSLVYLPVFFFRRYLQMLQRSGVKHHQAATLHSEAFANVLAAFPSWRIRCWVALHRFTTVYYLCMILSAVAALTINPYFAAIHLFGLIYRSAMLRTVIVAITQNGKSLALTMGLGVIVVYMFSIVGYTHFPVSFDKGDESFSVPPLIPSATGATSSSLDVALR